MDETKAEQDSLEETTSEVARAFNKLVSPSMPVYENMIPWVRETYPDYVIVCTGGDEHYKVTYTYNEMTDQILFAPRDQWLPSRAAVDARASRKKRSRSKSRSS